jgi:hypothetical protein
VGDRVRPCLMEVAGLSFDDEGDLHVAPRLSSTSRVDASGITSALRIL